MSRLRYVLKYTQSTFYILESTLHPLNLLHSLLRIYWYLRLSYRLTALLVVWAHGDWDIHSVGKQHNAPSPGYCPNHSVRAKHPVAKDLHLPSG